MQVTKFLEKKSVIRTFGVGLLIAPLLNSYLSLLYMSHFSNKVTFELYLKILWGHSLWEKVVLALGIVLSVAMLSGSQKMWGAVLVYLGIHLADQVMHLGTNLRINWIYGLFFLINLGVFLYIADQLVWKQKTKPSESPRPALAAKETHFIATKPMPKRQGLRSQRRIIIHFHQIGPWARLMEITEKGLHLRALENAPDFIEDRPMEIALSKNLVLKTRFKRRLHNDYFFEFENLSTSTITSLNEWIVDKAS